MSVLCYSKISDWKSQWTDGFLKDLNLFFFQIQRKSKNALHYQKTKLENCLVIFKLGWFWGWFWTWPVLHGDFNLAIKISIFVQKDQKMKHPKMALRRQIDPLIKSFGHFMFNEEVFKNSLVYYLKCFVNEGKQSTTIHRHSPNKVDDS